MARKNDTQEPDNQDQKTDTEIGDKKRGKEGSWIWRMIRENAQDFFILLSIILGLKPHPKEGETLPSGKQTPNWVLSMFPGFTDEDEVEFNLARDSHKDPRARKVEAAFRENFVADGYDETIYRVRFIKLRREYMEQLRSPAPEDKSGGRLVFTPITLRDSVIEFLTDLIAEIQTSGTPEEIYKRQRKMALDRKLLVKKNWLKKRAENKLETLAILISIAVSIPCLLYWILYWIFG